MSKLKKPLIGKGEPGTGMPAVEHGVRMKVAKVGKDEITEVPVRTGPGSGLREGT